MTATRSKQLRVILIVVGLLSLLAALLAWDTVVDRPLSREYVEFLKRAESLSAEERARQQVAIQRFDYSGVWRDPFIYLRAFCPVATAICFLLAWHFTPRQLER
jgi:hypothetical protein